jgi:hypothetical protein
MGRYIEKNSKKREKRKHRISKTGKREEKNNNLNDQISHNS